MCAKLRVVQPDEPDEPIDQYLREVKSGTTSILPYDRLMIYFRKNKMYAEELDVIQRGINTLKKYYANQQSKTLRHKKSTSIKLLSEKIGKSTGLFDKKGNDLFLPEPLPRWMKRKEVTQKKLKTSKKVR